MISKKDAFNYKNIKSVNKSLKKLTFAGILKIFFLNILAIDCVLVGQLNSTWSFDNYWNITKAGIQKQYLTFKNMQHKFAWGDCCGIQKTTIKKKWLLVTF